MQLRPVEWVYRVIQQKMEPECTQAHTRARMGAMRLMIVMTQLVSLLGIATVSVTQPALPESLAALQSLIGAPERALADSNLGGAAATVISGTVFQDFNSNGVFDSTTTIANGGTGTTGVAVDKGVSGVTVSAYVSATTPGAAVASTTSEGVFRLSSQRTWLKSCNALLPLDVLHRAVDFYILCTTHFG
jgi:hypothetical protein